MGKSNLIAEPGKQEFFVARTFDAPVELLYRAYADPQLLRQWLGPNRMTFTVLDMDLRPGGSYHWVQRDPEGNEYGFRGVVHSVEPNKRIVQTFEFEGVPGHVSLEEAIFEALPGGKSQVTTHAVYQSVEDRDGMIGAGMQTGMDEGYERLDKILAQIQNAQVPAR